MTFTDTVKLENTISESIYIGMYDNIGTDKLIYIIIWGSTPFRALFKHFQCAFQGFSAPHSCGKVHINIQYILYIQYTNYFTSFPH